jgi:ribosomal protein L32
MTPVDELRDCLACASRQAVDADTQQEVDRAIVLVDKLSGPALLECPVCGRMGLPDRIVDHDLGAGRRANHNRQSVSTMNPLY